MKVSTCAGTFSASVKAATASAGSSLDGSMHIGTVRASASLGSTALGCAVETAVKTVSIPEDSTIIYTVHTLCQLSVSLTEVLSLISPKSDSEESMEAPPPPPPNTIPKRPISG